MKCIFNNSNCCWIYKDLCSFNKTPLKNEVEHLINSAVVTINENTLHETLNAIYPFIDDDLAIKDISKFEDYRRNYPDRYEWRHFQSGYFKISKIMIS